MFWLLNMNTAPGELTESELTFLSSSCTVFSDCICDWSFLPLLLFSNLKYSSERHMLASAMEGHGVCLQNTANQSGPLQYACIKAI